MNSSANATGIVTLLPVQRGARTALFVYASRLLKFTAICLVVPSLFLAIQGSFSGQPKPIIIAAGMLMAFTCFCILLARSLGGQIVGPEGAALVNESLALALNGQTGPAAVLGRRALWRNPLNAMALSNLAYLHLDQTSDSRTAVSLTLRYAQLAYVLAGSHHYGLAAILDTLGWAYYKSRGELNLAEKHLRVSLGLLVAAGTFDNAIEVLYHLTVVLKKAGRAREARAAFDAMAAIGAQSARAATFLAATRDLLS